MPAKPCADAPPPTSPLTFVFTDIEGSTRLWEQDAERMRPALARHDALVRMAVEGHHGRVVKMIGDGVHAVFADPLDAVGATLQLQHALVDPEASGGLQLRVRCGLHLGMVEHRDNDFFGTAVNRAARIMATAHGGQVIVSQAVAERVADRLPQAVSLRDLGSVRLRDLASPERVYQVVHPQLRQDFPALRSLEATPNNLTQQVTSFIGRERELADVKKLLANTRLATLLGAGGLGKTRLSQHVAVEVLDSFAEGVWVVELAPLSDGRLLAQAVAAVLGVKEEAGRPVQEALLKFVKDRQLLLVFDNCEHLLQSCAELAKQLLQAAPELKILAISREPLHMAGEATYLVPTLSVPEPRLRIGHAELAQYEAVRLFIDRAVAAQPAFALTAQNATTVADICRRLDGIPLALELTAARVRALSVEAIATRLSDRFRLLTSGDRTTLPRQQTLRACIDWSYDLLTEAERALLRRLAVFAGGWTLDAAETVGAGVDLQGDGVLDALTRLVEKSLVAMDAEGGRYRLLETVREYADDRMRESGDGGAARARHFAFYLAFAGEAELKLTGAEQAVWLRRLEEEHENLRAGLDWSLLQAEAKGGLRLSGALQRFWYMRGHLSEGRDWCQRVLVRAGAEERTPERAKALNAAGQLAFYQSDYLAARALHEECLAIRRKSSDRCGMADSLNNLGNVTCEQGDYASARALHEKSLAIRRELGDRSAIARSLGNLGNVACDQHDIVSARMLYAECLANMRELGDQSGVATTLNNLGNLAYGEGDFQAAQVLYEESLAIMRELGGRSGIARSLGNLGNVAFEQGDFASARARYEECLSAWRGLGHRRGIAYSLEGLAAVAAALGNFLRAAGIWGVAERLREEVGSPLAPNERPHYGPRLAAARAALGNDGAFDRAWREGRALTLEQAIEVLVKTVPRP